MIGPKPERTRRQALDQRRPIGARYNAGP